MNRKFTGLSLALAVAFSVAGFAQNGGAAAPAGAGASPAAPAASAPAPIPAAGPTKVGIINYQAAVLNTTEGKRDWEALQKKYEPKTQELQKANQEVEELKKKLQGQVTDEERANLTKQLEQKQRNLQHNLESAQADFQGEQGELMNRLGGKVAPVLEKWAKDNGYGVILDVSNPQTSGVLWAMPSTDITEAVVRAYDTAMPAAPSATTGAARPPAQRPAAPAATAQRPASATPTKSSATPPKQQ
jgi:outer membrane protein